MHKVKRVIAVLGVLLLPAVSLAANEVITNADTTLVLGSDSSNYTLKNTSQFDSMTADTTTFSFTLSQGGRVTLVSPDRKKLNTNASPPVRAVFTCGTDQSQLDLTIDDPFTTTTVIVTPTGTCSTGSGTGGGSGGGGSSGGGGGGGGTSTAPGQAADKLLALQQKITSLQTKIAEKRGTQNQGRFGATPPAFGVFARNLAPGQRDEEVRRLQELLARDKAVYPEGTASGFFGPATTRAVKNFQKKYGLPQVGTVGPQTRKKLEELFGSGTSQQPAPTPQASTPTPTPAPSGQTSAIQNQIRALQAQLLQQQIKLIQDKINSLKK
ncbi:MAG: peptidoglycan-binding protein [Candidatus Sungbacteria bacterium]|uniref:Peptidoglycan-binding protein n=1 Tax=Candidatus Sungiibacteriota bacterium TaxID=2750080 RepID=A0A932QYK7_9BACT|nr:peptidoglycan-binding protein [Candidatus Sungbacteria bacterium]